MVHRRLMAELEVFGCLQEWEMRMNTLIFANNANIYANEMCIQKGMRGIQLWIISRRGSPSVMHRRRGA